MSQDKLIRACLEGNQKACRDLYDLHKGWLYAICLRYHQNSHDAEDSLQESFILIYRKLDTFKGEGDFRGWMRKIAVNCILSSFRKHKLKTEGFTPLKQEAVDLSLLHELDANELRFFIQQLSPGRKQVFIAHAIDGYTHKEIGEMLNISEGTSKSQFFDARKELKKSIEKSNNIANKDFV